MSGLVKAHDLAAVRSLGRAPATAGAATMRGGSAPSREEMLEVRLAQSEAAFAELEASITKDMAAEFERGRRQGLAERDESAAARLALIEAGVGSALEAWEDRLNAAHQFAIEIARTVLERMIGNPEWRAELITSAVADRVSRLGHSSVTRIRVSAHDFADDELPPTAANIVVEAVEGLESGACTIALAMGEQEIGPAAQWQRAAGLLDRLAAEADRPC